ncbi:MAG TPA: Gfo/Idh/MocA family oxidoreductase [Bryobacteraceae bacterium]|nr:Gfo/Idh/MocA family oxidoreductase [Bryobacteraceae bacterium]
MSERIRFGVLGVANIAVKKVIPAMQKCERAEITAIASRELGKAREAAQELGIPKAYGSYAELLADPEIDAIYNPLPNHLHVPWSIKAAEAGKHVLCEKPIALSAAECAKLIAVRDRTGVKMAEAFMVATQPRWLKLREMIRAGRLGKLRSMVAHYSYFNTDPANVRNVLEWGGGGVMDIGCYPIFFSRWIFGEEPVKVFSAVERDPAFKTDILTSAILEFSSGRAIFTCGTQLVNHQIVQFLGTEGRVEMDWPMNTPPDKPSYLKIYDRAGMVETLEFPACDQYTTQGDAFAKAIQENAEVPVTLEGAYKNMQVIERVLAGGDR